MSSFSTHPSAPAVRFLEVPYEERGAAKALGARWDAAAKKWFVPEGRDAEVFAHWMPSDKLQSFPPKLPKTQLFVELVPKSAWYTNLRSELLAAEWKALQRLTFQRTGWRCEICEGRGPVHPVECHERWSFDTATCVQTLLGTVALCPACHQTTHFGLAEMRGQGPQALAHLMAVNGWSRHEASEHVREAYRRWGRLSRLQWKLEAAWLGEVLALSAQSLAKLGSAAPCAGPAVS